MDVAIRHIRNASSAELVQMYASMPPGPRAEALPSETQLKNTVVEQWEAKFKLGRFDFFEYWLFSAWGTAATVAATCWRALHGMMI